MAMRSASSAGASASCPLPAARGHEVRQPFQGARRLYVFRIEFALDGQRSRSRGFRAIGIAQHQVIAGQQIHVGERVEMRDAQRAPVQDERFLEELGRRLALAVAGIAPLPRLSSVPAVCASNSGPSDRQISMDSWYRRFASGVIAAVGHPVSLRCSRFAPSPRSSVPPR